VDIFFKSVDEPNSTFEWVVIKMSILKKIVLKNGSTKIFKKCNIGSSIFYTIRPFLQIINVVLFD